MTSAASVSSFNDGLTIPAMGASSHPHVTLIQCNLPARLTSDPVHEGQCAAEVNQDKVAARSTDGSVARTMICSAFSPSLVLGIHAAGSQAMVHPAPGTAPCTSFEKHHALADMVRVSEWCQPSALRGRDVFFPRAPDALSWGDNRTEPQSDVLLPLG